MGQQIKNDFNKIIKQENHNEVLLYGQGICRIKDHLHRFHNYSYIISYEQINSIVNVWLIFKNLNEFSISQCMQVSKWIACCEGKCLSILFNIDIHRKQQLLKGKMGKHYPRS